ncbi:hypothetical protein N9C85_00840 [Synechococcus sp. AH-224-I15]|nr:hypothetical protein [Synechococcus sp. AH-224-I15]
MGRQWWHGQERSSATGYQLSIVEHPPVVALAEVAHGQAGEREESKLILHRSIGVALLIELWLWLDKALDRLFCNSWLNP